MNEYEITYLSDTQLNEEARGELDNAIDGKINDLAGSVNHSSPSLRTKLAYPIEDKQASFLRTVHVELEPDKIGDFRQFLKKKKGIIRFTVINTPYRPGVKAEDVSKTSEKPSVDKSSKKTAKPAKKVTMEDVEKGIEEVLSEDVK